MAGTRTLKSTFDSTAEWHPNNTAFVQASIGKRYTYGEANEASRKFANGLSAHGVSKGDRVALLCRTTVEHAISFFAIQKLGAISATLHSREAPNTIKTLTEDIDAQILIFEPEFSETAHKIKAEVDGVDAVIALDQSGECPGFAISATNMIESHPSTEPEVTVAESDPAFINFSSGTTGHPKGVVHTHEETIESNHIGQYIFSPHETDVLFNPFTPSFIGWPNMGLPVINAGGTVVFMAKWDASAVPEIFERYQVTISLLVPTQWKLVLQEHLEEYDLSSLKMVGYAGEAISPAVFEELKEKVCESVFTIYGTTELMLSGTTLLPYQVSPDTLDTVGKPIPSVEVRIIDTDDKDPTNTVPQGEVGELIVRGPSVSQKIWDNPEKTKQIFHEEGWWFSGDLAFVDNNNNINIKGRVDNMIISGGINIYGEGVEAVLEEHPDIVSSAVIGVPHEKWGQAVKAYVVTDSGSITDVDLDEWCKGNEDLGDYQRPREWKFVDELPRTNTGKLDRQALRNER